MKFRKLGENKIHCIISREEMDEKGIELDDFLEHQDKTEDFLREVLAEARYELDLPDTSYYYSVQMSVMPEGDVSLVISGEDKEDIEGALSEFGKKLQNFKEIMSEAKKQLDAKKAKLEQRQETTGNIASEDQSTAPQQQESRQETEEKENAYAECPIWIRVDSLEHCITIAKNLQKQGELGSALYKYEDAYYMQISFTKKEHQVAGTILVVSEYATEVFTDEQGGSLLTEHGTPICRTGAIEMLAQL